MTQGNSPSIDRDRALRRARRLRWWIAFVSFALSAAGAGYARAAFSGHHHSSTRPVAVRQSSTRVAPLGVRPVPNDVPLPPAHSSSSGSETTSPSPAPSTTTTTTPAPAPAPQPAPVVTRSS